MAKAPVNIPAQGTFTPPPAGAPQEVSQPLHPSTVAEMQAKADANEKDLAPLKFALDKAVASVHGAPATPPGVQTAPPSAAPDAPAGSAQAQTHPAQAPPSVPSAPSLDQSVASGAGGSGPEGVAGGDAPPSGVSPSALPALPPNATPEEIADPVVNARPARGQPKPILDPGKQITGGWGLDAAFPAQYYALDGAELQALAQTLWKELTAVMEADLRFRLACVYPQAFLRITVEVAGATAAAPINDVAFTLDSRVLKLQVHRADDQTTPADALRVEAGLARPYKHPVVTPTGTYLVDQEG